MVDMHIKTCAWLEDEAIKLTEEWYALEKRFRKLEENGDGPDFNTIIYAEKIETKMAELENRMIMEDKIYQDILKKIDDPS
jgi:predicted nuclease with TOPRIM domain